MPFLGTLLPVLALLGVLGILLCSWFEEEDEHDRNKDGKVSAYVISD